MGYVPYADRACYREYGLGKIPEDTVAGWLRSASRHIDSLTFNRIISRGFDALAGFQQEVVKEVTCKQAEFEFENEDLIESVLSSYAINGVSMSIKDSWNLHIENGVVMKKDLFSLLAQTGLTCRLLR